MTAQPDQAILSAFPAIAQKNSRILILGSMPGVASLETQQYYAHPRNAFWKILAAVYHSDTSTWSQRITLLKQQQLALWDVLSQCQRRGSLDANIRSESIVCNDFAAFLKRHSKLQRIIFNGKTAERLFLRHVLPELKAQSGSATDYDMHTMPSTSPAMASLDLAEKTRQWRQALSAIQS